jgi:hypothetical protein
MLEREAVMKPLIFVLGICLVTAVTVRGQETSPGGATIQSAADIPEGYEIGEKSLSPNGRFAILYPIRGNDSAELPPNLLVCLKPYSVLTRIGTTAGEVERQLNRRDLDCSKMGDEGSGDL